MGTKRRDIDVVLKVEWKVRKEEIKKCGIIRNVA